MTHYDLVVLGAGSGNTVVDDRFDHWRVAIVERGPFGGTCLNRGCIPSKVLVAAADVAQDAADGPRLNVGTRIEDVDWPGLRERTFGRTDGVARDGRAYREKQENVEVLIGTARFTGPRALVVDLDDGGLAEVTADRVVIATGSRPVVPGIPGLADVAPYTSDDVMRMERLPARLGIVGGGYVGCELAHVFASLGVAVTQIESEGSLLGNHDADVSEVFTRHARERWDVRLGAGLEKVTRADDGVRLHLEGTDPVVVDAVLVAVGRRPNSDSLDVEAAGVEVDDKGLVVVDEFQRSTADGVWALGDASSHEPLKHVANQDARVVRHNLLVDPQQPADLRVSDHRVVPSAVFSSPQVAAVGLTEAQARAQGLDLAVARHDVASTAFGWAKAADDSGWFCKLLADRATGRLVGAHIIGPQAAALIQPLVQAMSFDQPVAGLAHGQYWIHPAPTEVVENALVALEEELA